MLKETEPNTLPNKEQTTDLMMSFFRSKAITAALDIKLFDYLDTESKTLEDIAKSSAIPLITLKRLAIALTAMGYIDKTPDGYCLHESQKGFLVSDQSEWLGWLGRHIDNFLYPLWSNLGDAVREDKDQRFEVFGDTRSWFDILYENPSDVTDFQEFLGQLAQPFIDGFVADYDFGQHRHFLDIGSGIGSLPMAVVDKFPDLTVSICELPQAHEFLNDKLAELNYADRISVVDGNVISGDLPEEEYDLVHLGWMLHDYDADTQMTILKNIYQAMPVGGRFIASETPLNNDNSGPEFISLLSLNMLVSTDGGIESTVDEYINRFEDVGFCNVKVLEIPGPRTLFLGEKSE